MLAARAGEHEQVARVVDAQNGAVGRDGAQDVGHFARRDVMQRHDHDAIARRQRVRAVQPFGLQTGGLAGGDMPDFRFFVLNEHRAVAGQQRFEQRQHAAAVNVAAAAQRDVDFRHLVDGVVHAQQIAQQGLHDFGQRRIGKFQPHALSGLFHAFAFFRAGQMHAVAVVLENQRLRARFPALFSGLFRNAERAAGRRVGSGALAGLFQICADAVVARLLACAADKQGGAEQREDNGQGTAGKRGSAISHEKRTPVKGAEG